jgi:hypothetical protein
MMLVTAEQVKEIIGWRNRNQRMLWENYPHQFIAFSATKLLAAGMDYQLVITAAEATGEPFLIDWISALSSDVRQDKW